MSAVGGQAARRPAPLLPPGDVRDAALVFIIAVLVFLASLTALGALAADRAAQSWTDQLTGSATAVVRPGVNETPDMAAARAAEVLAGVPGVREARAMDRREAEALLEPWLGKGALTDDLPTPRLVALDLDPGRPATAAELDKALKLAGLDAVVDDHGFWLGDLKRGADLARLALAGVFLLIALAAAAVVAFATEAGLAAHRDVVEVLHLAGARPGYVAWLFVVRFAWLAGLAGLIGGGAAAALGAIARLVMASIGSTPQPWVAWSDLLLIVLAPLAASVVAAAAAQLAALRMVGRMT